MNCVTVKLISLVQKALSIDIYAGIILCLYVCSIRSPPNLVHRWKTGSKMVYANPIGPEWLFSKIIYSNLFLLHANKAFYKPIPKVPQTQIKCIHYIFGLSHVLWIMGFDIHKFWPKNIYSITILFLFSFFHFLDSQVHLFYIQSISA